MRRHFRFLDQAGLTIPGMARCTLPFLNSPHFVRITFETVEKPAFVRLMENVHPAGFAAGRNPEE
jgi:hypothetical protein